MYAFESNIIIDSIQPSNQYRSIVEHWECCVASLFHYTKPQAKAISNQLIMKIFIELRRMGSKIDANTWFSTVVHKFWSNCRIALECNLFEMLQQLQDTLLYCFSNAICWWWLRFENYNLNWWLSVWNHWMFVVWLYRSRMILVLSFKVGSTNSNPSAEFCIHTIDMEQELHTNLLSDLNLCPFMSIVRLHKRIIGINVNTFIQLGTVVESHMIATKCFDLKIIWNRELDSGEIAINFEEQNPLLLLEKLSSRQIILQLWESSMVFRCIKYQVMKRPKSEILRWTIKHFMNLHWLNRSQETNIFIYNQNFGSKKRNDRIKT